MVHSTSTDFKPPDRPSHPSKLVPNLFWARPKSGCDKMSQGMGGFPGGWKLYRLQSQMYKKRSASEASRKLLDFSYDLFNELTIFVNCCLLRRADVLLMLAREARRKFLGFSYELFNELAIHSELWPQQMQRRSDEKREFTAFALMKLTMATTSASWRRTEEAGSRKQEAKSRKHLQSDRGCRKQDSFLSLCFQSRNSASVWRLCEVLCSDCLLISCSQVALSIEELMGMGFMGPVIL
jgi:hypothetical protein